MLVPYIGTEFMPKADGREFTFDIKMEEGTTLQRTDAVVENIEYLIKESLKIALTLFTVIAAQLQGYPIIQVPFSHRR